jgi:hypothetical protein
MNSRLVHPEAQNVRRTFRVAIMAGAIGTVIGAGAVIAGVGTVLTVITPQPAAKQTPNALAPGAPDQHTAAAADRNGCDNQTWPNIDSHCVRRATPVETTGGPSVPARPPAAAPVTQAALAPAELRPGSSAVPAPSALLDPQPTEHAVRAEAEVPNAEPPKSAKPSRKADRHHQRKTVATRQPDKSVARHDEDDDNDDVVITQRRVRPQPIELDDAAPRPAARIERPRDQPEFTDERPQPHGLLGGLFSFGH